MPENAVNTLEVFAVTLNCVLSELGDGVRDLWTRTKPNPLKHAYFLLHLIYEKSIFHLIVAPKWLVLVYAMVLNTVLLTLSIHLMAGMLDFINTWRLLQASQHISQQITLLNGWIRTLKYIIWE